MVGWLDGQNGLTHNVDFFVERGRGSFCLTRYGGVEKDLIVRDKGLTR